MYIFFFSQKPTEELLHKNNDPNVVKCLNEHIQFHGLTRSVCLDETRSALANKLKNFGKHNKINRKTAPENYHRANGLVK